MYALYNNSSFLIIFGIGLPIRADYIFYPTGACTCPTQASSTCVPRNIRPGRFSIDSWYAASDNL